MAGAFLFRKTQQVSVINLNANVGIKILWVPSVMLCTDSSAEKAMRVETEMQLAQRQFTWFIFKEYCLIIASVSYSLCKFMT